MKTIIPSLREKNSVTGKFSVISFDMLFLVSLRVQYKVSAKTLHASHWHGKGVCGKPVQPCHACPWDRELQPAQQACSSL